MSVLPGHHIGAWLNYASWAHTESDGIAAIILGPHIAKHAKHIYEATAIHAPVIVERHLFAPNDVAVTLHAEDLPVCLLKWRTGEFERHPGMSFVSHKTWCGMIRDGWYPDQGERSWDEYMSELLGVRHG